MIRLCLKTDINRIYFIINEAAKAYDGVIPDDCYRLPYMPLKELQSEMQRMTFYGWEDSGNLVGVMGSEPMHDVTLVRHAYVLPEWQSQGIGAALLSHVMDGVNTRRVLVGTWTANIRAIKFYQRYGFILQPDKDRLLKTYWGISPRQIETSVVLERRQGLEIRE